MTGVPEDRPVTTPVALMIANDVALQLQIPPLVVSVKVAVFPKQIILPDGLMGATTGRLSTATECDAESVPQELDTV